MTVDFMTPLSPWVILIGSLVLVGSAWAGSEEEAVERAITAEAKSAATFPETRDKQAILKLYTADYSGIQDGEPETLETIETWFGDYETELNRGSTLRFLGVVSNVKVQVTGPTAWATYDYVFQAIRKGELEAQDTGKCTSLLRKESSAWLIFHEHCSKIRPGK
jgi:ketosteroid isomerase-like protein